MAGARRRSTPLNTPAYDAVTIGGYVRVFFSLHRVIERVRGLVGDDVIPLHIGRECVPVDD